MRPPSALYRKIFETIRAACTKPEKGRDEKIVQFDPIDISFLQLNLRSVSPDAHGQDGWTLVGVDEHEA